VQNKSGALGTNRQDELANGGFTQREIWFGTPKSMVQLHPPRQFPYGRFQSFFDGSRRRGTLAFRADYSPYGTQMFFTCTV
jgi:hypothetical protein